LLNSPVDRAARRALMPTIVLAVSLGCSAPIVYRNPTTSELVNCSEIAADLGIPDVRQGNVQALPPAAGGSGTAVPRGVEAAATLLGVDAERQCMEQLRREGWICVAGCRGRPD
jgi:hypothetical protein